MMSRVLPARCRLLCIFAAAGALAGCWAGGPSPDQLGSTTPPAAQQAAAPAANAIGTGPVKVALVLPLTAAGNAGTVAQSMRNGAELAMTQFETDIQVLPRDDAGNSATAQQVT
jgi:ABC-type branched-subunit amino acid transport system substrate-binding protein